MATTNNEEEKVGQGGALKTAANFLIIIAVAVAILFFLDKAGKINLFSSDDNAEQERMDQTINYYNEMQEKYKNDTYGGATPEETLKLFIAALKAGDTDLASKYFVVEKQEEMATQLANGKQNNTLPLIISDLEKAIKNGKELYTGTYQFVTFDKNNVAEFSFDLTLNSQTKKWKLESL